MPSSHSSKGHSPLANGGSTSTPKHTSANASASSPSDSQLSELKDLPQSENDDNESGKHAIHRVITEKAF